MANLELEGKISQKLPVQSGQSSRGPWKKQDFVLDYQDGSYPAQALFTAFGDNNVAELEKYGVGDKVRVSFNIRAREYNGRWYNDIRMWRISPITQNEAPMASRNAGQAAAGPAPAAPAPGLDDMPEMTESENDDMPF